MRKENKEKTKSIIFDLDRGTSSICCPLNCGSLHLVSRSSLKTLCIIHSSGSLS